MWSTHFGKVFFLIFISSIPIAFSQNKEANVWCFGQRAGLDFATGTAVGYGPTSMYASLGGSELENSTSISDEFGNLLFYTKGDSVWDKAHTLMPNGAGLMGHESASQGVLIAPAVSSCDRYYIFTVGGQEDNPNFPGLRYSTVDMSLQGNGTSACPQGDIISSSKNIHLTGAPLTDSLTEKITSVMHANGTDYWIIVREWQTNTYYSFLVTAAGVNPVPVHSTTGNATSFVGYLKPSKDGKSIVHADLNFYVELIDFNNTSGVLSNAQVISVTQNAFYGAAFSCNDSVIYASAVVSSVSFRMFQYQRFAANIPATETIIGTPSMVGGIQLGPDGKIYSIEAGSNAVSVINNPNSVAFPNYVAASVPLAAGTLTSLGAPTFFHGYESKFCTQVNFSRNYSICPGNSVQIGFSELSPCHKYSWSPSAGLSNNTLALPQASPTASTTYTVTITTINCDTYVDTIRVNVSSPVIAISGITSICEGQSSTLSASGGTTFSWNTGTSASTITVSPTSTATYSVIGADANGCTNTSQITVTVTPGLLIVTSNDTSICPGANVTLTASGGAMYSWSSGEVGSTSNSSPIIPTIYTVSVTSGSCTNTKDINVSMLPTPNIDAGSNTIILPGNSTVLSASGGSGSATYQWSPSSGLSCITCQNPVANPQETTTYYVQVTDANGCMNLDSVMVEIKCKGFYIPNAFSPNNDGENDVFYIQADCLRQFVLIIWDRWGEKIFETADQTKGWDGGSTPLTTSSTSPIVGFGRPMNTGVFVYTFKGTSASGEEMTRAGTISLIR